MLGLIGTTVVPYNLFLDSGIARGQKLAEARLGLGVAIVFGGLISMAVMLVGSAVAGQFSYAEVGTVLSSEIGSWVRGQWQVGQWAHRAGGGGGRGARCSGRVAGTGRDHLTPLYSGVRSRSRPLSDRSHRP